MADMLTWEVGNTGEDGLVVDYAFRERDNGFWARRSFGIGSVVMKMRWGAGGGDVMMMDRG